MNASNGGFGVSMDKAWRLVFPPPAGNDSPLQVPCEGDALGASAIWICGVWSSGPILLYSCSLPPGNMKSCRNGEGRMDICWPHKTTTEYSRLLSSKELKHLMMLFGTGVTEGTPVAMGFARVCKHKSVITFVILMPYVRHLTLISMA